MYEFLKCRCHGVRFARMKALAKEKGLTTVAELQRHVQFGDNCRRCLPFVRQMLETGQTVFKVMEVDDFEELPNAEVAAEDDSESGGGYDDEDEL
ncbi:(2Fe-2S)-binding protein [bacterium AH-315-J21]|nr:(2Fe-2S)-binding protein [bacterium AH-315-J21]